MTDWHEVDFRTLGEDDPAYPRRLRRRLRGESLPVLFERGDAALLGRGGIALVFGTDADPAVAADWGRRLAASGLTTILHSAEPLADTHSGPTIVLEHAAAPLPEASPDMLLLRLTPPGTAAPGPLLERCRYGLADAAVLLGLRPDDPAWDGALAAIASQALPVWVAGGTQAASALVRLGASLLDDGDPDPRRLLRPSPSAAARVRPVQGFAETQDGFETSRGSHLRLVADATVPPEPEGRLPTLHDMFETHLLALLAHGPLGAPRIAEAMALTREQTDAWLLRTEAGGRICLERPLGLYALPTRSDST